MNWITTLAWSMIWSGYNGTLATLFDLPHLSYSEIFNSLHSLRPLLPVLAGIPSLAFLLYKKYSFKNLLTTPLGLLTGYGLVSSVSSALFSNYPPVSVWWGLMYGSVVFVLGAIIMGSNGLENISSVLKINLLIASVITLGLMGVFLMQPGSISSISLHSLFSPDLRPFESFADTRGAMNIKGMPGTRPTGLGRYAAVAAIMAISGFFSTNKKIKWLYLALFPIFTAILLFSRGKTEILAFLVSLIFVFFISRKFTSPMVLVLAFIIGVSVLLLFGHIAPTPKIVEPEITPVSLPEIVSPITPVISSVPIPTIPAVIPPISWRINTLGGRLGGSWAESLKYIKQHILIGNGFMADKYLLKSKDFSNTSDKSLIAGAGVDGTIFQSLLTGGLTGTIFFLISLLSAGGMAWHIFKNYSVKSFKSSLLIESSALGIFFVLRSITQSSAGYSADFMFLAPVIAYLQIISPKFS